MVLSSVVVASDVQSSTAMATFGVKGELGNKARAVETPPSCTADIISVPEVPLLKDRLRWMITSTWLG
jgi:hypothetical protein